MNTKLGHIATRSLLAAGLALGITAVHARDYNITRDQEQMVQAGMTAGEIRAAFGAPTDVQRPGNGLAAIWSYRVADATPAIPDGKTMFEVEFDTSGRVVSASEFVETPVSDGD